MVKRKQKFYLEMNRNKTKKLMTRMLSAQIPEDVSIIIIEKASYNCSSASLAILDSEPLAISPKKNQIIVRTYLCQPHLKIMDSNTQNTHRLCHGEGLQEARVLSASYSPDGQFIVTTSEDKTAKVWSAATSGSSMKCLGTLEGHGDYVNSASYSPDGQSIVTASFDGTAKVWSAATMQLVGTLEGHGHFVRSASYSPDGKYIVTASSDKTAKVWSAATMQLVGTLEGHKIFVTSASYSPDGKHIVTADMFEANVWSATSFEKIKTIAIETRGFTKVNFMSHDGSLIISSDNKNGAMTRYTKTFEYSGRMMNASFIDNYVVENVKKEFIIKFLF